MGFMNAALGFLFLAIVYLSSQIRAVWGDAARTVRATRECVNQREMSTTFNRFFGLGKNNSPAGGSLRYNQRPAFSLTISCHPGKRRGNRQKKRRRPRHLSGAAVHEQLDGDCPQWAGGLRARVVREQ